MREGDAGPVGGRAWEDAVGGRGCASVGMTWEGLVSDGSRGGGRPGSVTEPCQGSR